MNNKLEGNELTTAQLAIAQQYMACGQVRVLAARMTRATATTTEYLSIVFHKPERKIDIEILELRR